MPFLAIISSSSSFDSGESPSQLKESKRRALNSRGRFLVKVVRDLTRGALRTDAVPLAQVWRFPRRGRLGTGERLRRRPARRRRRNEGAAMVEMLSGGCFLWGQVAGYSKFQTLYQWSCRALREFVRGMSLGM